jgi:bacillithiol biosynthesis cysteine-adding enzyme BshC
MGGPFTIGAIEQRELPGQSRLYLDLLAGTPALNEFYPNAVSRVADLKGFVPAMLQSYNADREILADGLAEFNREIGSGKRTFDKIERLRSARTVAVVTGQQAGLFSGPAYSIYKAVSAIVVANELSRNGVDAVPVFWIASEDHDLDEVSRTFVLSNESVNEIAYRPKNSITDTPVGSVLVDDEIDRAIEQLFAAMPQTAFTDGLRDLVSSCWRPGRSWSDCFAATLARLFAEHGLVFFDPMLPAMRWLASAGFTAAIEKADEIVSAVRERCARLESLGYHAQVLVEKDHFTMFWIDETGARRALRRTANGFRAKGSGREFTSEELLDIARSSPESLSPGVLLRPVIQDMILPTAAYIGGAAEIAYFAQNSAIYKMLERPVTPVLPRHTATIVSARSRRAMEKLDLSFQEIVNGKGELIVTAAERENPEIAREFAESEEAINTQLNRLDRVASDIDPTVAASFAKRRRKMIHHIGAARQRALLSKLEKDEVASRRVVALQTEFMPRGALQERSVNSLSFINEYGKRIVDDMLNEFAADERRHLLLKF